MIIPEQNTPEQPDQPLEDLLERACVVTGLTMHDILELMESELATDYLLEYITAVTSNLMN